MGTGFNFVSQAQFYTPYFRKRFLKLADVAHSEGVDLGPWSCKVPTVHRDHLYSRASDLFLREVTPTLFINLHLDEKDVIVMVIT